MHALTMDPTGISNRNQNIWQGGLTVLYDYYLNCAVTVELYVGQTSDEVLGVKGRDDLTTPPSA